MQTACLSLATTLTHASRPPTCAIASCRPLRRVCEMHKPHPSCAPTTGVSSPVLLLCLRGFWASLPANGRVIGVRWHCYWCATQLTFVWTFSACSDSHRQSSRALATQFPHPPPTLIVSPAVNGQPSCVNRELLQGVLRDQMGFQGYVVTDCTGGFVVSPLPTTVRHLVCPHPLAAPPLCAQGRRPWLAGRAHLRMAWDHTIRAAMHSLAVCLLSRRPPCNAPPLQP